MPKRFLLIFVIVFTVACVLCSPLLADASTGTHGESGFYVAFMFCFILGMIAFSSAFFAGIIHVVLPKKPRGR